MNDQRCVIREAGDADVPAAAGLYRAFLQETVRSIPDAALNPKLDAEYALTMLIHAGKSTVLVAETEGKTVGFVCVHLRPGTDRPLGPWERIREFFTRKRAAEPVLSADRGYLAHLFVSGDFRRRGIGTALVGAAGDWAKRRGAKSLDLNVLADNEDARRLYRKLGMSEFLVHYRMKL